VRTSPHVGTHADAPRHFLDRGVGIGEVDLEAYVGPCFVVDGPRDGRLLEPADLEAAVGPGRDRILVRTHDDPPGPFPTTFSALSVEAARWLADHRVLLVGLDTPSVDPFASTELPAHHILAAAGIAILENLVLAHVRPGPWELIAPPLRWEGLDASPVRALLRSAEG
jgi:arylformamidase